MLKFSRSARRLTAGALLALLAVSLPASVAARTIKVNCSKGDSLQVAIDRAVADADVIEIRGMCEGNFVIRDKRAEDKGLTLIGAGGAGPHGILGMAANTDTLRIENSRDVYLEGLTISNPLFTGVRIRYFSWVGMTDCVVNDSQGGAATGVWVMSSSEFRGNSVRLNNNLYGLGAAYQSRAWCWECDLSGNLEFAALAGWQSSVELINSEVSGSGGLKADDGSRVEFSCGEEPLGHSCKLNATGMAVQTNRRSEILLKQAGDFYGYLRATDHSQVELAGTRQQSAPGTNRFDRESWLYLTPGGSPSRLMGTTDVRGFSHAMIENANTQLDGSLVCDSGGDAWVHPDVSLAGYSISGCDHAP